MGVGYGSGKEKADQAADMAISSPLLETSITGAQAAIINICGPNDLEFGDAERISTRIQEALHPMAAIYWGIVYDDSLNDEVKVTVIATGFDNDKQFPGDRPSRPKREYGIQSNAAVGGESGRGVDDILGTWFKRIKNSMPFRNPGRHSF